MKNTLKLPSRDEFQFKDCVIAGDDCWLIIPKDMGTTWSDENARFRSCIVRKEDNFVVSQSFGKFTNYGEKPAFQPWDDNAPFEARHKLDGSLLIVSHYKGEWILRTRGTTDARQLANGHEIDLLMKKYSQFFDSVTNLTFLEPLSFLFEWTTPTNIIVLREHNEPTLTLLGMVLHENFEYVDQYWVDQLAEIYNFERPKRYTYTSMAECIADVKAWVGKEGVVCWQGQIAKKVKGDAYLAAHRLATGIKNVGHVLDLFVESPRFTKYSEFYEYIEKLIDFEVAEKCKDYILQITVAYSKVVEQIEAVNILVKRLKAEEFSRKECAEEIMLHYVDWRRPVAFKLLDGKEIEDKLIYQAIESEL